MPRTPDRTPGISIEEGVDFEASPDGLADAEGKQRYESGRFSFYDSIGEYDPRSIPPSTQVGQLLYSVDGSTFTVELPVTSKYGWLVNYEGVHLVVG